jgi:multiple sugar transport system permease protein/raffinose/stachyose/melibiose transport system permease protein
MQTLNRKRDYILLTAPALLIYTGLMLFPVVYSFFLGFFKWDGSSALEFIGLSNYSKMFTDPIFYLGLKNNILIVLVSMTLQIPFGFLFAYIIHRKLVKGTQFFQAMIFLPVVISAIVVAILA